MIWDKAQDLGRLIGQSDEYKALRRAEGSLREDKETIAKLDSIQQLLHLAGLRGGPRQLRQAHGQGERADLPRHGKGRAEQHHHAVVSEAP